MTISRSILLAFWSLQLFGQSAAFLRPSTDRFGGIPLRNLQLSARIAHEVFFVGEPIEIEVSLRNVSETLVMVRGTNPFFQYTFDVLSPPMEEWLPRAVRNRAPRTREAEELAARMPLGAKGAPVPPNQELTMRFDLTRLHHMEKPGKYYITSRYQFLGSERQALESNEIKITIIDKPE